MVTGYNEEQGTTDGAEFSIFENWLFRGFFLYENSQQTDRRPGSGGDTSRKESQISVRVAKKREIFEHEAEGFSQTRKEGIVYFWPRRNNSIFFASSAIHEIAPFQKIPLKIMN